MPHGKLRTENNCLNCNAQVSGRFCSVCGQENIEPKETFWQLVSHIIYDLFHYDGKVLSTLKTLLLKPGVLTHEYVRGRRASYLHPVRLYIFISAVFFIIFISFIVGNKTIAGKDEEHLKPVQQVAIEKTIDQLQDSLNETSDTLKQKHIQYEINALKKVPEFFQPERKDKQTSSSDTSSHENFTLLFNEKLPNSLKEYNLMQTKLTPEKKDGRLKRIVKIKALEINEKYKYDSKAFQGFLKEHFLHSLPTMMFISLPAAAMILFILFIRRRKQFTYVHHGVFSLHVYSAVFVFILMQYILGILNNYLHWGLITIAITVGNIFIFYYVYKSMRNFYEQRRLKTFFKYVILLFCYSIILSLLMAIFLLTSLIRV